MGMGRGGRGAATDEVVLRRLEALVAEIAPPATSREVESWAPGWQPEDETGARGAPDVGERMPTEPRRVADAGRPGPAVRVWEFARAHVAVVAIIGLAAVAWALLGSAQARTVPVEARATPVLVSTPTPTPTPLDVRVHVVGGVVQPGVVHLPQGARVGDALEAAGGVASDGRLGDLNLAAVVPDGAQLVVGTTARPASEVRAPGAPSGSIGAGGVSGVGAAPQLNLNTATLADLETLPGVGPVTAQSILAWRTQHQRFTRVEELQEVDGIGPKTMEKLRPHVRV